jgi:serine/threonine protein kinase
MILFLVLAAVALVAVVSFGWWHLRQRGRRLAAERPGTAATLANSGTDALATHGVTRPELEASPSALTYTHAGARMGRYRLKKCVATRSWSNVYEALDQHSGQRVAVKLFHLPPHLKDDPDATAQVFDRELQANQRLEHPGIVRLLDFGYSANQPFLVMQWMPWPTLAAYATRDQRLPWRRVASVLLQIAQALQHAHERGVIHRDVKAENVFFDPETGHARLADLGIARLNDAARTATGVMLGTPGHMAPEQILGAPIDARSDVYALGVLAYQLLSGALPHEGYSGAELLRRITQGEIPDMTQLRPDIPPALAQGVNKALQRDPNQRWRTAQQWAAHLRETIGIETERAGANIDPQETR